VVLWSIWRPLGGRPNYLGFQASRGAHHSLEESQIHEFERDLGDLSTWVVLAVTRSTIWHLYWSDLDIFGSRAELLRLFSVPAGRGIFQLGGLALHTAQISSCIGLHCVFSLWRLIVSSLEHFVAAPIMFIGSIC
jgi:hypothetical protein